MSTAQDDENTRLKDQLQRAHEQIAALRREARAQTAVRAQWGSVANKLMSHLDAASAKLPTMSQIDALSEGEWLLLGGVRDRLQALDARLAALEARRATRAVVVEAAWEG